MKHNVLVMPCGAEIGLEIHRSLGYSTHFELYGASSVDDHGQFVYKNYIGGLPYVDEPDFVDKINEVIKKHNIEFVFPAHDAVVLKLAQAEEAGELACRVITSPAKTCEIARSKKKTYQFLDGTVPVPKVFEDQASVKETDLPVFLKPDVGQGAKGTHTAKTIEDIKFYIDKDSSLLILENLPGKEYTVDCFTNREGKLLFCEGRERARVQGGISVHSKIRNDERFMNLAKKISEKLKFRGVWFFQVKENKDDHLVLMEIAPRVAGTMGLSRARGINLPLLSLFDALDISVDIFKSPYEIVIDRALHNKYKHDINYQHVYLDFDDLVIYENKVNPYIMAFVYQCHNNGKKVHLLTRHKGELPKTLKKYRLNDAFDEITWLKPGEEKHEYIKEKDAIFIDDSFAERQKVHHKCGIPTFDSHMIESLMEKY